MAVQALALVQQAATVITDVVGKIKGFADAVRGFVDAFNPRAGENFDRAMRSLNATIGYALEPILVGLTEVVDQLAGSIVGAMDALREPIAEFSSFFVAAAEPLIAAVGGWYEPMAKIASALTPLLEPLATLTSGLGAFAQVVTTLFGESLLAVIEKLVPGAETLESWTEKLTEAFVTLIEVTLRWADAVLDVIGLTDVYQRTLEALLKERPKSGRPGAPTGYGMGDLADVYRRRLLSAAQGGPKSTEQKTLDVQVRIKEVLEMMLEESRRRPGERERKRLEVLESPWGGAAGATMYKAFKAWQDRNRQEDRNET